MNLESYRSNTFSQCGQDGVIAAILEKLHCDSGYCVEFGAWDGVYLSNTRRLLMQPQWAGCLIESDTARFASLDRLYANRPDVSRKNVRIQLTGKDSLDSILSSVNAPKDFELLSVDIDSDDYHIWASLRLFSPKIVLIETNPYFPLFIEFVQKPNSSYCPYGASALSMYKLGVSKGYVAVAYLDHDWLFVREDVFEQLGIERRSFVEMFVVGCEIRNNEKISTGERYNLPTGLASRDMMDVHQTFNHQLDLFRDAAHHFRCLTSTTEFKDLV